MKTLALGFAAALALGIASSAAPASAAPVQAPMLSGAAHLHTTNAYYARRSYYRRGPVCTWRTVVTYGPYGKRVKRVRVCR
ncbi:MAG: hypothetical protein J0I29_16155 [Rhizobiales bacterium]|nr:hypothetical protein [Hyphomicrobiales bacterium]